MISTPWWDFYADETRFFSQYQIRWLVKQHEWIRLLRRVEEYFCSWHIVGWTGTQRGGMGVVTSEAVTQSESHVPWWPCTTQTQIPERLQPSNSLLCRQTAGSTFHSLSFLENPFILFSARWSVLAPNQHVQATMHTCVCTQTGICAWMQKHRLRLRLLIHKVFSGAVIYAIALSLNTFEWDQSNHNSQCLMVKGCRREKKTVSGIKQTVPSCGCAFENPSGSEGCVWVCVVLRWAELTITPGLR